MITEMKQHELAHVLNIWLETNIDTHHFIDKEYWNNLYPLVKELLPIASIYVYRINGHIAGFIGLQDQFIEGIFVDKKYQSKGYGKELLNYVKYKNKELKLKVYKKNKSALNFYLREQFVIVDESMDTNTSEWELTLRWLSTNA